MTAGPRMMHRCCGIAGLSFGLLAAGPALGQEPPQGARAIVAATLIDGTGAPPVENAVIVIRDGRIVCVGSQPDCMPPPDAEVLDATGRWVIPGLVDTHIHLTRTPSPPGEDTLRRHEPALKRFLYFGVTTAREMSGSGVERRNVALKEAVDRGAILGPRLYVSAPASPQNFERLGAADTRELARQLVAFGVDGIKLLHLSADDALTVIDEVQRISALPVYGHTFSMFSSGDSLSIYTLDAVRAGLAGVVHVEGIPPVAPPLPAAPPTIPRDDTSAWWLYASTLWLHADEASIDELIAAMVERGTWLEPTLVTTHFFAYTDQYADHPYNHLLPIPFERWSISGLDLDGENGERYRAAFERMKAFVRRFHAAGGLVVTGSDNRPVPGFGIHDELRLLVEAGLSPMAALQAATINGARALGWEDRIGTVEVGKLADLVVLEADPLDDIGKTHKIWRVIRGGRVLDPDMLLPSRPAVVPRRVWSGADVDVQGDLSPDGQLVSFVDWSSGDLAVRHLGDGVTRRVTGKSSWDVSGEFAGRSVFSLGGERLAFAWYDERSQRYDLRILSLDGSDLRVPYDDPNVGYIEPLDWSPDGRAILATLHGTDRTPHLALVSAEDGSARALVAAAPGTARFSPDGGFIAYDAPRAEGRFERDIFLLPAGGGTPRSLIAGPADDRGPQWMPDGSGMLFVSDRGASPGVWHVAVADGRAVGEPKRLHRAAGPIQPLALSRSGDLYYATNSEVRRIDVAALDSTSGEMIGAPRRASGTTEDVYSAPAWSPDGRHLVYVSSRGGPGGDRVFVLAAPDAAEERAFPAVTGSTGRHAAPRWSPDGRRLIVSGCAFLCIVDVEAGSIQPVERRASHEPGLAWRPVWSPDGSRIFFLYERGLATATAENRLAVLHLTSGRETELYRGPVRHLALSPDGEWLAFWEHDPADGASVIKLIPSAGGAPRQLLRALPPSTIPTLAGLAWTPDGRHLLFPRRAPDSPGQNGLWQLRVNDGAVTPLAPAMEGLGEYGVDVAPGGVRIAFNAGASRVEIWVLEHLLPEGYP